MVADAISRSLALALLATLRGGSLTIEEEGRVRSFGSGALHARIEVLSPRFYRRLLQGSRGLALAYRDRDWESPDPVAVIRLAARNASRIDRARKLLAPLREPYQLLLGALARNTPERAREDIAAHYDIGNELFSAMLDETMSYSCAFFPDERANLDEAARAKLELIGRRLQLHPEDHVLEIGGGWGSFALFAARRYGCRVTTTTISREQARWLRERVGREGLADRVTVLERDYRELRGRYDKLCSIEMIEAVGHKGLPGFFERCSQLLIPGGTMLLQAIVIDDRAYRVERISRSFIRTLIFPNGCLPSQGRIARTIARRTDMSLVSAIDMTPHYVLTLRAWRERFKAAAERLAHLGYDEPFQRLWSLYLCYCEAGFAERRIELKQYLLAKARNRAAPRLPAAAWASASP
jgi:cyclopropane-fatty-acyl-phospholipid synthase